MNFNCRRCGKCCKEIGIPWSELDVRGVANHLKMSLSEFVERYGFVINEYSNDIEPTEFGVTPCPFIKYNSENAICTIYPVRPWICVDYPGQGIKCREGLERP
ncbi:YkgJ family cysteine cluster protein [Thermodesulfobacteriota bacterium]